MKALVIYDLTGKIWNIVYGEEIAPQGLTCMWVDIPDGAQLERIDVTNPDNPHPVFNYLPESDIGKLQKEIDQLKSRSTELENRSAELEASNEELTLAIAEMIGGEN